MILDYLSIPYDHHIFCLFIFIFEGVADVGLDLQTAILQNEINKIRTEGTQTSGSTQNS